jgi:hypothetical protein
MEVLVRARESWRGDELTSIGVQVVCINVSSFGQLYSHEGEAFRREAIRTTVCGERWLAFHIGFPLLAGLYR